MKRHLICGLLIVCAALLLPGCASNGNESAGGQPDNVLNNRADTVPENDTGLGNSQKQPVGTSVVRPTDEATKAEYRKLSEGIIDENGQPTTEGAGGQPKQ